jgi:hypothetical protein
MSDEWSFLDDDKCKKGLSDLRDGSYSGVIDDIVQKVKEAGKKKIILFVDVSSGERIAITYAMWTYGGKMAFKDNFPFIKSEDARNGFNVLAQRKIDFDAKKTSDSKWVIYTITKVYDAEERREAGQDGDESFSSSDNNDDNLPF